MVKVNASEAGGQNTVWILRSGYVYINNLSQTWWVNPLYQLQGIVTWSYAIARTR